MSSSVEPFDPERHKRGAFQSGTASVDNFLKLTARKLGHAHASAVFVIADEEKAVIGYYALASITVDASEIDLPKVSKLFGKFGAVPAKLLSFLGVDRRWQGQGIGKVLLADALRRCHAASSQVGSFCVLLGVLDDGDPEKRSRRQMLYESIGFRVCNTRSSVKMFLTMSDIGKNLPA